VAAVALSVGLNLAINKNNNSNKFTHNLTLEGGKRQRNGLVQMAMHIFGSAPELFIYYLNKYKL